MATSTQTATLPVRQGMPAVEHELHELRQIRRPATSASLVANAVADGPSTRTSETVADQQQQQQQQHTAPFTPASTSPTWLRLKIFGVAFSFFCAGVNDSTLGPLVPYMLTSFSIGTGEIAILYACSFTGWLLAAVTNPLLTPHLTLGQLLLLGAALQLLAQCLRPWWSSPFPLFCLSFALQALGQAYQDAHGNTFVSGVGRAQQQQHRWLGVIHVMYALALVVGPLVATTIAASHHPGSEQEEVGGRQVMVVAAAALAGGGESDSWSWSWRRTYFVTIAVSLINLVCVVVGFRDSLWRVRSRTEDEDEERRGGPRAQGESGQQHQARRQTASSAMREMGVLLKVKDVWMISLFFFFALGASMTSSGWVVAYLAQVRGGALSRVGYVPTGYSAGLLLGRLLLPEPTFRFGEKRMILIYFVITIGFQLIFWLVPNIIADATALSIQGFFQGPFFATGVSVASKLFPRKIQAAALSFVFVLAQAGAAIFPSITGLIAGRAGVHVLQPIILALLVGATVFWWFIPKASGRRE